MKQTEQTGKVIRSFIISFFIFSLAALIIAVGLSIGRSNLRTDKDDATPEMDGSSFNLLLIMSDYAPEMFDDYDPRWVKNVLGLSVKAPSEPPTSVLLGYRKVYTENMVIVGFDKEKGNVTFTPVSGSTLVTVKGVKTKLEAVAGEWGVGMLIDKVHAITGLRIDNYAVFTPKNAAVVFDLIGGVDYTVKCNMRSVIPERGIDIDIVAGTYRLDGTTTVDMLRFDEYSTVGMSRGEVTLGYARRLLSKLSNDLTTEEKRAIITEAVALSYTNFDINEDDERLKLMLSCDRLEFMALEVVGNWQVVGNEKYFVLDETKTIEKLTSHRK